MAVVKTYIYDTYKVEIDDQYVNKSKEYRDGVIQRLGEILSNEFMKNPEAFIKKDKEERNNNIDNISESKSDNNC